MFFLVRVSNSTLFFLKVGRDIQKYSLYPKNCPINSLTNTGTGLRSLICLFVIEKESVFP